MFAENECSEKTKYGFQTCFASKEYDLNSIFPWLLAFQMLTFFSFAVIYSLFYHWLLFSSVGISSHLLISQSIFIGFGRKMNGGNREKFSIQLDHSSGICNRAGLLPWILRLPFSARKHTDKMKSSGYVYVFLLYQGLIWWSRDFMQKNQDIFHVVLHLDSELFPPLWENAH